ncbi:HPF/RaiA family ribosome-associated protein [uncultured Winogradskyella sp.]|uniref:HPF/RaiA family ribosome-associated protein n=1 Tax=uncultured Winogradskyella sp. TaxID=395353 RepID=UPI002625F6BF|nr:HPF/RaiA family ribosome-associated protein [uncultured Winogradskyella sp.]
MENNKQVIFEYHDVTASDTLKNFTKEKLESLFIKFDFVIRADVFFKIENTSSVETGMKCGIRLSAPGPRLFAESSHNTFQDAVTETVSELKRQLKKRKESMKNY